MGTPNNRRASKALQWGHALSGMDMSHELATQSDELASFNGAMPFQAWIRFGDKPEVEYQSLLQWGHALSGMDTCLHTENNMMVS